MCLVGTYRFVGSGKSARDRDVLKLCDLVMETYADEDYMGYVVVLSELSSPFPGPRDANSAIA